MWKLIIIPHIKILPLRRKQYAILQNTALLAKCFGFNKVVCYYGR